MPEIRQISDSFENFPGPSSRSAENRTGPPLLKQTCRLRPPLIL